MSTNDDPRWSKVKALFRAARELPRESRLSFLRDACGDDAAVLAEVSKLLQVDASDSEFEAIIREAACDTVAATAEDNIDLRVGNYRLVELIGSGGMGNVYLAKRDDDQFEHRVAIKLLHTNLRDEKLIERFQVERQTLANLDHPNIAKLLDGGETDDGTPYLVMEYVDGVPINQYCDQHRQTVQQRLQLFRKVCAAVDYAHRSLVVHRDIKPSNLLVNNLGEPKLLDFGIAKFIGSAAANLAIAPTRQGQAVMTPEFASPEQVRGEPITTATDVYSLGVLLYILLSGRAPYFEHASNMAAIARAICDTEPSRPSTVVTQNDAQGDTVPDIVAARRTSAGKLAKLLTGDLDNIAMMTLQKEPERRYSSARALSDDVENYLTHKPVVARPDSLLYRAGKFVRRHRWGVSTSALLLVLVVGFPSYYSVRVSEQRDIAEQEAETADRVAAFMLSLFRTPDPDLAQGKTVTARELLDQGALRIEQELAEQPSVRAAMQDVMGGAYQGLGLYAQSQSLLDHALRTRISLHGDEHIDVLETASRIADLATSTGDYQKSEALYIEALQLSRKLHGEDSPSAAALLTGLANALYEQGRHGESRTHYEMALAMHERLSQEPGMDKAITMHGYGWLLTNMADFEAAEAILQSAVTMLRETAGDFHPEVAAAMNHLTYALMDSGQWDAAEINMREGLALNTRIYGDSHPSVSGDLFTLGTILQQTGKFAEAESLYRRGLAIDLEYLGESHPYIASDKNNLAGILKSRGNYQEAVALYRESLALNEQLLGKEHPETATSMSNLGLTLLQLGEFDAARDYFTEALRIRIKALGGDHPATLSSRNIYAIYLRLNEDFDASRAMFETSLENRTRVLGETHTSTINTLLGLSELLRDMALLDEAAARASQAQSVVDSTLDKLHPISIRTTVVRATILDRAGDTGPALLLYEDALARYRLILPENDPRLARALIASGDLIARAGQPATALPLLEEALVIREAILPDGHWEIAIAQSVLGSCQGALGLPGADAMLLRARDTLVKTRGAGNREARLASARLAAHRDAPQNL